MSNFKVTIGNLTETSSGGVFLDTIERTNFMSNLSQLDDTNSAVIPYGTYDLIIVLFSGPGLKSGTMSCGSIQNATLDSASASFIVNLSPSECSFPLYSKTIAKLINSPSTSQPSSGTASTSYLKAKEIYAGYFHTCALLENLTFKCWGANTYGELGQGNHSVIGATAGTMGNSLLPIDLGTGLSAIQGAVGQSHSCALLNNGTVKCWGGFNTYGQLGQGSSNEIGGSPGQLGEALPPINLGSGKFASQIATGALHTCALLSDGSVKCWGYNGIGQCGQGIPNSGIGFQAGDMGDNLPPINLGTGRTAKQIATGNAHTCAILDNNTLKCWGYNNKGQLGFGDTTNRGNYVSDLGDSLPVVNLGTGLWPLKISAGDMHTCALLNNYSVKCWGDNTDGELGLGDSNHRGDTTAEMGDNLPPINLGTGRTAIDIMAGYNNTCAILDDHSLKCWGKNDFGQLGIGDLVSRGISPSQMGDNLPALNLGSGRFAIRVSGSNYQMCALLDNGAAKCWGMGNSGQLGQEDSISRGGNPNEVGDTLLPINLGIILP